MKLLVRLGLLFTITSTFSIRAVAQTTDTTKLPKDTSKIFMRVETIPEFKGGNEKFAKFLNKNLKYPKQARIDKIQGTVILTFVVEKDGTLSDLRVIRGVSPELDQEALRLMSILPPWVPGTQGGKPVRVQFSVPIGFRL